MPGFPMTKKPGIHDAALWASARLDIMFPIFYSEAMAAGCRLGLALVLILVAGVSAPDRAFSTESPAAMPA
jgi:hypothetical protein